MKTYKNQEKKKLNVNKEIFPTFMVTENLQPNYVTAYYQVNKCWHNKKKFYKKINQIRGSKSFFFWLNNIQQNLVNEM